MKPGLQEQLQRLRDDFDASFSRNLQETGQEGLVPHLAMRVGDETFAVPITRVRRLVRDADVVPLPGAPGHLLGVVNVRGELITVYDLPALFGYPAVTHAGAGIVVIKGAEFEAGLAVTEIGGLMHLDESTVGAPPSRLPAAVREMVQGTTSHEGKPLLFPDLDALFVQLDARN